MKKIIASTLASFALLTGSSLAHAYNETVFPTKCTLAFTAQGGGLQIVVGYFKLEGIGDIHCVSLNGDVESRAVRVTIGGHPIAARVGIGLFRVYGLTESFGLDGSIDGIYGNYTQLGTMASAGLGVAGAIAIENPLNGLNMNLNLSGVIGLGAEHGLSTFTIEPL